MHGGIKNTPKKMFSTKSLEQKAKFGKKGCTDEKNPVPPWDFRKKR